MMAEKTYLGLTFIEFSLSIISGIGLAGFILLICEIIPFSYPFAIITCLMMLADSYVIQNLNRNLRYGNRYDKDYKVDTREEQDSVTHEYNWNHESFRPVKMLYLHLGTTAIIVICVFALINIAKMI